LPTSVFLNDAQRAAVEHPAGPLLVLAGAGSGKTRVLTERVGRLLEGGLQPDHLLAFTFTNRAAREMRERIERRVGAEAGRRLWVGTFHGTGLRILRREARREPIAGRGPDFVIYDREDQEGVLKEVLKGMGMNEEAARPDDFELASYWEQSAQEFRSHLPRYYATFLADPSILRWARYRGWRLEEETPEGDRVRIRLRFDADEEARQFASSFGPEIEVVEPAELRDAVIAAAREVVKRYA